MKQMLESCKEGELLFLILIRIPNSEQDLALSTYFKESYEDIERIVVDKIEHYKRPLIAGTDEYYIIFQKFYEEELKRKGMF